MNRKLFINSLKTENGNLDKEWIANVITDSIDSNKCDNALRGHRNLIIVMEELAELTQEISKELRGKRNDYGLLEELADVQLGIYYVQNICNISTDMLHKAMNVKMNRMAGVLSEIGQYK